MKTRQLTPRYSTELDLVQHSRSSRHLLRVHPCLCLLLCRCRHERRGVPGRFAPLLAVHRAVVAPEPLGAGRFLRPDQHCCAPTVPIVTLPQPRRRRHRRSARQAVQTVEGLKEEAVGEE
eukprot:SAG11_NODE_2290_length_3558_cov_2.262215_2_plen_120_part_00